MPELPEVQSVRQSLADRVLGRTVRTVELRRATVVEGDASLTALLAGCTILAVERLGKQLAIVGRGPSVAEDPRCVCVHLGMTGSLCVREPKDILPPALAKHIHIIWLLDDGRRIEFRDPRRFGGAWTFPNLAALREARWRHLGEDALTITPAELYRRLHPAHRPIKAALLDQGVVAGLGNIYVDELLFRCGIHPRRRSSRLERPQIERMVRQMRRLLERAIEAGGSTLRDYVSANGQRGRFQTLHRVYGRTGQECLTCGTILRGIQVAGRTTVFCPTCQRSR